MPKTIPLSATITVASGVGSTTVSGSSFYAMKYSGGKIKQVIIEPGEDTYKYDFYITNPAGKRIYERKNRVGTISESDEVATYLGNHTFGFENADDGTYIMTIIYEAEW